MLDHFGSGISCDQTCKWDIEWDILALKVYLFGRLPCWSAQISR